VITPDAVRSVRPGYGALPKLLPQVIGKRTRVDVSANTPVRLDDLLP
jgi:N-acetylneuraminate synthase